MRRVVGIIGSLRKESIHRTLFEEYKNLSKDRFELVEGEIKNLPLYDQDLETNDSAKQLGDIVNAADGVIFFTPEYNYSVPGGLKNAIDWLSRDDRKPFDGKDATIVGASPGSIGTARMQYHLRQIGVFLNLKFMNKPEVMIGAAFQKIQEGKIVDEGTVEFLKKHVDAFASQLDTQK